MRVIDYVREVAEFVPTTEGSVSAAKMLERFLFEGSEQYTEIGRLSGGEKRRLNLLRVLMGAPNVLILDKPTNDLDITTCLLYTSYRLSDDKKAQIALRRNGIMSHARPEGISLFKGKEQSHVQQS